MESSTRRTRWPRLQYRQPRDRVIQCTGMQASRSTSCRRRVLGAGFLILAIAQVAAGFTVLHERLSPVSAALYWTVCLLATLGAMCCALLDALHQLRSSHQERRTLLEDTLREIDRERARQAEPNGQGPDSD